ncbi:MAG: hypothetical protein Q9226_009163 [Calogaya cf. arnoldii]
MRQACFLLNVLHVDSEIVNTLTKLAFKRLPAQFCQDAKVDPQRPSLTSEHSLGFGAKTQDIDICDGKSLNKTLLAREEVLINPESRQHVADARKHIDDVFEVFAIFARKMKDDTNTSPERAQHKRIGIGVDIQCLAILLYGGDQWAKLFNYLDTATAGGIDSLGCACVIED